MDENPIPEPWSQQLGAPINAEMQAQNQHYWHLKQCMDTLLAAQRIRQDAALMAEICAFVRKGRDELATLLDET